MKKWKKNFFSRLYLTIKKISIKIYNNKHIISTFTNKNITKHWIIYENFINDFMKNWKNEKPFLIFNKKKISIKIFNL